jgi:hypothetical protein
MKFSSYPNDRAAITPIRLRPNVSDSMIRMNGESSGDLYRQPKRTLPLLHVRTRFMSMKSNSQPIEVQFCYGIDRLSIG